MSSEKNQKHFTQALFVCALFIVAMSFVSAYPVAQWNLNQNGDPSFEATKVYASDFRAGQGVYAAASGVQGGYSITSYGATSYGWSNNTYASYDDYYLISVHPEQGYTINIDSILFGERRSSDGPRNYDIMWSKNSSFSNPVLFYSGSIPDDEEERNVTADGENVSVGPEETIYIAFLGHGAENETGNWTILGGPNNYTNVVPLTITGTVEDLTAPVVNVGADVTASEEYLHYGSAFEEGSGIASYLWTQESGQGNVSFGGGDFEDANIEADTDGNYTIRLTVTDNAGNSGYDEFNLNWDTAINEGNETGNETENNETENNQTLDITPPVIGGYMDLIFEAESAAGVNVSFTIPTFTDDVDGIGNANCTQTEGVFALGDTIVTCSAEDSAGNDAENMTFIVRVVDTTIPTMSIDEHANTTVSTNLSSGAVVNFTVMSHDLVDGDLPAVCTPANGSLFAVGSTQVTCGKVDAAGNVAMNRSFDVNVILTINETGSNETQNNQTNTTTETPTDSQQTSSGGGGGGGSGGRTKKNVTASVNSNVNLTAEANSNSETDLQKLSYENLATASSSGDSQGSVDAESETDDLEGDRSLRGLYEKSVAKVGKGGVALILLLVLFLAAVAIANFVEKSPKD